MLASLRHPCICAFYGVCHIGGSPVVVMERLECSVDQRIKDHSFHLSEPLCLQVATSGALALA